MAKDNDDKSRPLPKSLEEKHPINPVASRVLTTYDDLWKRKEKKIDLYSNIHSICNHLIKEDYIWFNKIYLKYYNLLIFYLV